MTKLFLFTIIYSSLLLFVPAMANPLLTATDFSGQTITLIKPATRIIALTPSLTEILFAIGAGSNVIGVSVFSDFPPAAKKIAVIANSTQINLEAILKKRADLVVAENVDNSFEQLQKLKQLHIPVYVFTAKDFAAIPKVMRDLGILTGHQQQGEQAAAMFSEQLNILRDKYQFVNKKTVFYQIWQHPLFTVGQVSLINKAISLCRGKNIFANTLGAAPQISLEAVLIADPELIIGGYKNDQWQQFWQHYRQLKAVKAGHLYSINPDLIDRAGPRLILGIQQLCYLINHGG